MKRKLILLTAFTMLLCSCASNELSSDESKVTSDTTNAPFVTTANSNIIINDEFDDTLEDEVTGFSFDYTEINKCKMEYDGEEISFGLTFSASGNDCGYTLALICGDKLIPFSINEGEYSMSHNVLMQEGDEERFVVRYKPYGKAGETLTVQPLIVCDTKAKPVNDYNFQSPWCGYVLSMLPTGYVTLNVDGIDSEESSKNADITEISQEILDYYTQEDEESANLSEDGVLIKTLETNNSIEILDPDAKEKYSRSWAYSNYMISDGQLEFDALFYGQPNKVSICCWSDKGFLPVFDGKYTVEVELEEYYQQAKIHCKLEDESFGEIERIEMIAFSEDKMVYLSGATGVITSQTYEEFLKWCETLE